MSNIAFLFLPLAFSSFPAVLPFVSPSSQVLVVHEARGDNRRTTYHSELENADGDRRGRMPSFSTV